MFYPDEFLCSRVKGQSTSGSVRMQVPFPSRLHAHTDTIPASLLTRNLYTWACGHIFNLTGHLYYSSSFITWAACALQDVVMMCQTIEKLFEQKLQAMPKEVGKDLVSLLCALAQCRVFPMQLSYSGTPLLWTPWGPSKLSCIERCPHFRGKFILR